MVPVNNDRTSPRNSKLPSTIIIKPMSSLSAQIYIELIFMGPLVVLWVGTKSALE